MQLHTMARINQEAYIQLHPMQAPLHGTLKLSSRPTLGDNKDHQ